MSAGFRDEPFIDSTDAHWPVSGERHVAGCVLPAAGSSEADVFRAFGGAAANSKLVQLLKRRGFAQRTLADKGEIHVSVPVMSERRLLACLSIRCPRSMASRKLVFRRYVQELRHLAAELEAAAA